VTTPLPSARRAAAGLVLQTILPPLLTASGPSTLVLEGGTHNPLAPAVRLPGAGIPAPAAPDGSHIDARLERSGILTPPAAVDLW